MKGLARDTNDGLVRADPDRPASFSGKAGRLASLPGRGPAGGV